MKSRAARGDGKFCSLYCSNLGRRKTTAEKFWDLVTRTEGCWLFGGYLSSDGYGRIHVGNGSERRVVPAHRVSWELHHGAIPAGLCVLHKCDNPPCVNPNHLFLGTQADNMADKMMKGRHVAPMKGKKYPPGKIPGRPKGVASTRTPGIALGRPKGSKLSPESLASFRMKRGFSDPRPT